MMATCNGHYLSFFWCHTLVNRMQLGLHWCVAGRCPVRTQESKVRFADYSGVIAWWLELIWRMLLRLARQISLSTDSLAIRLRELLVPCIRLCFSTLFA